MSHELEIVDGKAQMAYAGELPWHSLGTQVSSDLTPAEMLNAAGLDWTVEKQDVFFTDPHDTSRQIEAPKKKALVRSHDKQFLDIVSDNWIPVQNSDAFEFFADYVEAGGMEMHTAGSLKDGKMIWALAKVNDSFSLFGGRDQVDSYLLLSNPHQFGRGVDIRFCPIRVVCNNTLSLALEGKSALGISLNHRQEFDPARVREALEEASSKMEAYHEMSEFLASKTYNQDDLFEYFNRVFPKTNVGAGVSFEELMKQLKTDSKAASRNALYAMEAINEQPGAELGRGTWWQAYNTVTFMTNHVLGHNTDTRLQSAWYGANKDRNINALSTALEYAEAA